MTFYGLSFIFNNIYSDTFGLMLGEINGSGEKTSSAGTSDIIFQDTIYRQPVPYFYGTSQSTPLQFSMQILSKCGAINRFQIGTIQSWLFGHKEYLKLQVIQDDMPNVTFNAILNEVSIIGVGNEVQGFECTVSCDAPWGWGASINERPTLDNAQQINQFSFMNLTDYNGYTYPVLQFTVTEWTPTISIQNTSTNNPPLIINNPVVGETITIDNYTRIVSTSSETPIFPNGGTARFNGQFLKLVRGENIVSVNGFIDNILISYTPAREVGS